MVCWPRVPGAHGLGPATLRHGFSFLTYEMPARVDQLYSQRRREALAGYGPRRGSAARGSGGGSLWCAGFGEDAGLLVYPQTSRV